MSSRGEWRETKWVCTTHLEPAVASKAASEEPDRFARAVTALERALDVAKSTGDFASVHSRFQPTSQFFSARTGLRPEDLTRCAHVAIDVMHAVDGDVSLAGALGHHGDSGDGNSREEAPAFGGLAAAAPAPQGVPGRR